MHLKLGEVEVAGSVSETVSRNLHDGAPEGVLPIPMCPVQVTCSSCVNNASKTPGVFRKFTGTAHQEKNLRMHFQLVLEKKISLTFNSLKRTF